MPKKSLKDFETRKKELSAAFGKEILNHFGLRKEFKKDTLIFKEGEKGDYLFIIERGKIKVYHSDGSSEEIVAKLGAGSVVGEMAVLTGKPRSANVRTLEDTAVFLIDKEALYEIFQKHPHIREIIGVESVEREEENIKRLLDED